MTTREEMVDSSAACSTCKHCGAYGLSWCCKKRKKIDKDTASQLTRDGELREDAAKMVVTLRKRIKDCDECYVVAGCPACKVRREVADDLSALLEEFP